MHLIPIVVLLVGCDQNGKPPAGAPSTADVTAVSVSGDSGDYALAVTVRSPDTGCEQYADWWEVLDEEGALRYRRILGHSHISEQPFTRVGGPVPAAADERLVVRAHLSTGGYGVAFAGSPAGGFQVATGVATGFAAGVEQDNPQPSGCLF